MTRRKAKPKSLAVYIAPPKPKKKKRRKRKANPAPVAKKTSKRRKARTRTRRTVAVIPYQGATRTVRRRRTNPEEVKDFSSWVKPTVAAIGGYAFAGVIWKLMGTNGRKTMRGWFQTSPDAKARATVAAASTVGLYFLSGSIAPMKKYRRSLMIGAGLRLAKESADAMLSMEQGGSSETVRMIFGLPTPVSLGQAYVGKPWPNNIPVPPGTTRDTKTGNLVPASYDEENYPYADDGGYGSEPPGAYDPAGQYDSMYNPQDPGGQTPYHGSPPSGVNVNDYDIPPHQPDLSNVPPSPPGNPPDPSVLAGYQYRYPSTLSGFQYRQVVPPHLGGYKFRKKGFPRPF